MANIIDQFFLARIDRALDDARPLDRFTAWYVLRSPKLRDYYETLIEMELDLRFPEPSLSAEFSMVALQKEKERTDAFVSVSRTCKADSVQIKSSQKTTFTWNRTLAVALLLLFGVSLFLSRPFGTKKIKPSFPEVQAIDLANQLPVSEPFVQVEERKPIEQETSFFAGLRSPNDFIVRFSEEPLEATVSLLEMARIVQRYELREEFCPNGAVFQ